MSARNRLDNKAARREHRKTTKAAVERSDWYSIYERLLSIDDAS